MAKIVLLLIIASQLYSFSLGKGINSAIKDEEEVKAVKGMTPVFCMKPSFWEDSCKGSALPQAQIKVSKLPFNEDLWLHLDISSKTSTMKKVALALINEKGELIGRFAPNVPCTTPHPTPELYQILDSKEGMEIYECFGPHETPPTQPHLTFIAPVSGFYVHYKFTPKEVKSMEQNGFQIQMIAKNKEDECHTLLFSKKLILEARNVSNYNFSSEVNCHIGMGVGLMGGGNDSGMTLQEDDPQYKDNFSFSAPHSRKTLDTPTFEDEEIQKFIEEWNSNKYEKYLEPLPNLDLDERGGEVKSRQEEEGKSSYGRKLNKNRKLEVYLECGHSIGCIADPSGCLEEKSCRSIASYVKDGEFVKFEVWGQSFKYIALGLSRDRLMGGDSVVECVREDNNEIRVYTSWNVPNLRRNVRLNKNQENIEALEYIFKDGEIYCTFRMKKKTKVEGLLEWNLEKESVYLLLVTGSQTEDGTNGKLEHHDTNFASGTKILLYTQIGKSKAEVLLGKIHGVAMIIVWVCFVPLGAFISRYFKETFVTIFCGPYTLWYTMHVVCMGLSVLGTFASVGALAFAGNHWPGQGGDWNQHGIIGVIILCFLFIQLPLALCILKFNRTHKYLIINFIHGFGGHILFILGFVCIYKSREMRDGLPCETKLTLVVWIVTYFVLHLVMAYHVCYSDFVTGRNISRIYTLGPMDVPDRPPDGKEEPGALGRKFLLVAFITCSVTFVIVICWQFITDKDKVECAAVR